VLCGDWSARRAQALTAVAMMLGLTP